MNPPTGGTPLVTAFTLSVDGWLDSYGGPLTYAVSYIKPSPYSPEPVEISDFSSDTQFTFHLPSISNVAIWVTMKNGYGCLTNVSTNITLAVSGVPSGINLMQTAASLPSDLLSTGSQSFLNALLDQISIANQLLVCGSSSPTSVCNSSTVTVCQSGSDCSGQGSCVSNRCQCNPGYFLSNCGMSQPDHDSQLQYQQSLLDQIATVLNTNMSTQTMTNMLTLMNTLTQNPYLGDNSTLTTTLNSLNLTFQFMDALIKSNSTNNSELESALQEAANIISNSLNQITQLDCGLWSNFSLGALNSSYALLQELSEISLKAANSTNATSNFSTSAFQMISGIYNLSQMNNLNINASDSAPQAQLGNITNLQDLPPSIALTYIYLNQDPTSCEKTPSTDFVLQFQDPNTWESISVNTSVTVTYPKSIFKDIICKYGCSKEKDSQGNSMCSCVDVSVFDIKNQLGLLYENSNFKLITLDNIADIFKAPLYREWAFWVGVIATLGLISALIIVNTINKDFCIVERCSLSRDKGSFRSWKKAKIYAMVFHPILNIFCYKCVNGISKGYRALLYYVRVMALLGTSAIFMKDEVNYKINQNLLIYHLFPKLGFCEFESGVGSSRHLLDHSSYCFSSSRRIYH